MASSDEIQEGKRGIPKATFVEDVEKFLDGRKVDEVLKSLDERLQQYKLVEIKLLSQRRDLESKLPDIIKCIDIVLTLRLQQDEGKDVTVDFEIADGMYTEAKIDRTNSVFLWLGANVMLEYSFEEALELLQKNRANAEKSLSAIDSDLLFLRDQSNITEVTIARVFNWDVAQRRRLKGASEEK